MGCSVPGFRSGAGLFFHIRTHVVPFFRHFLAHPDKFCRECSFLFFILFSPLVFFFFCSHLVSKKIFYCKKILSIVPLSRTPVNTGRSFSAKTPPLARTNVRCIWRIPMKTVCFDRDYSSKMLTISPSRMRFVIFHCTEIATHAAGILLFGLRLGSVAACLFGVHAQTEHFLPIQTLSCFAHFVVPICRVGDSLCDIGCVCRNLRRNDAFLYICRIGQAQMLRRGLHSTGMLHPMPPQAHRRWQR